MDVVGQAQYLVTANTRHFPPGQSFAGVTIITPEAFLRLLAFEESS